MNSHQWYRAFLILLATCALVLTLSQQAMAERDGHRHHDMPAYSDLDGDGSLSADEFAEHHAQCPMHRKKHGEESSE